MSLDLILGCVVKLADRFGLSLISSAWGFPNRSCCAIAAWTGHCSFPRRVFLFVRIETPDHAAVAGGVGVGEVLALLEVVQVLAVRFGRAMPPAGLGDDLAGFGAEATLAEYGLCGLGGGDERMPSGGYGANSVAAIVPRIILAH